MRFMVTSADARAPSRMVETFRRDRQSPVLAIAGSRRASSASSAVKEDTLVVHEIYKSIQGESSFAGLACAFVRLTGCNLRCTWCDTPQAFYGGTRMRRADVLARALALETPLVELTGGEPLLQPGVDPAPRRALRRRSHRARRDQRRGRRLEGRSARPQDHGPQGARLRRVGSGTAGRTSSTLTQRDEIKFVLADRADYEWMRAVIAERGLAAARHQDARVLRLRPPLAEGPRRLGPRRRAPRPRPAPDAQIHLGSGCTGRLRLGHLESWFSTGLQAVESSAALS